MKFLEVPQQQEGFIWNLGNIVQQEYCQNHIHHPSKPIIAQIQDLKRAKTLEGDRSDLGVHI